MCLSWFAQKYRRACSNAIARHYLDQQASLMVDRLGKVYYSVWHVGDKVLEVVYDKKRTISIYEFAPVK